MAREAIADGGDDPTILALAAMALAYLGRDYDGALTAIDRALALSPHTAFVLTPAGWIHLWVGRAKDAVKEFKEAVRLSPVDPLAGVITTGLALAHLMDGDLAAALREARRAVHLSPYFLPGHRGLAVILVRAGREAEAREAISRLRQISPNHSIEMWRQQNSFCDREFSEMIVDALRRAGLPER
jgi:adenylate cyclase